MFLIFYLCEECWLDVIIRIIDLVEAFNPWVRSAFVVFYQKHTQASVEVKLLDSGFRALSFLQIDENLNGIPPTEFNL